MPSRVVPGISRRTFESVNCPLRSCRAYLEWCCVSCILRDSLSLGTPDNKKRPEYQIVDACWLKHSWWLHLQVFMKITDRSDSAGTHGDHLWSLLGLNVGLLLQPLMSHSQILTVWPTLLSKPLSWRTRPRCLVWHGGRQGPILGNSVIIFMRNKVTTRQGKWFYNRDKASVRFLVCRTFSILRLSRRNYARPESARRLRLLRTFPTPCGAAGKCSLMHVTLRILLAEGNMAWKIIKPPIRRKNNLIYARRSRQKSYHSQSCF